MLWTLKDLPRLYTGDLLAFEANGWWQKKLVGIIKAKSWHWAIVGFPLPRDEFSKADWSVAEAVNKGTAFNLLSSYRNTPMRVYRPTMTLDDQLEMGPYLLKRCCYYGNAGYDWWGVGGVGFWFVLKHLGIPCWIQNDMRFYCIEFCNQVWADLDFPICDMSEPPNPYNFENSGQIKMIWGTF